MTETLERNATAPAAKRDMPALSPAIDATEVDFVRYEGSYVLVQGK